MSTFAPQSPRTYRISSWRRYAVIALAVIVLCSCRTAQPEYRVADRPQEIAVSRAFDAMHTTDDAVKSDPAIQRASHEVPTHLTETQLARAAPIPAGYALPPCGPDGCIPGGCACCNAGPVRGPNDEYLCDGGDFDAQAAVVKGGGVVGLDPEDAVAHYDTVDGRTVITPSNKVCIYAPRFAAIRQVIDPRELARDDQAVGAIRDRGPMLAEDAEGTADALAQIEPNIHRVNAPPSLLRNRQHPGELGRDQRVAQTLGTLAAYANLQIVRAGEIVGVEKVEIARGSLAAITWIGDQAAQVLIDNRKAQALVSEKTPGTIYLLVEPNNPKLRLVKLASTDTAHPGEEVEFTLRFDNVGDRVIGNVTILDSLTTRLEYVEGSQKSTLDAEFDSRANEGSSLKLRWQINEPLKPGEGGVIQFRCKVR